MIACPSCGFEAPDDFAFCPKCATPLSAAPPIAEERKVVTTLICDLVAFTAMSESADPEDVDRLLGDYFAHATKVIESHGGTIEKFIGDAVVGVFGVPAVHEDDPERAVRAGLRLIAALEGMTRPDGSPLEARIGVNTGEALVRLDVDPASGRGFLTGDAVNTAARLEAAAPPGGVAVGALTHELTERVIAYEQLPPVVAKGKSEPVAAWRAIEPVARTGGVAADERLTPLIGRHTELARLEALFDACVESRTQWFALVSGEPGIGKSRLVRELFDHVDSKPEMTTWRRGHCLPYGEGVTFWALAEIVKAHAGIFDTDDATTAAAKLDSAVPEGPDREWLCQRLGTLLGLPAPDATREENFAAWLRFIVAVAARGPTVLVFEDLHWADAALVDFLALLAARAADAPLLVVATARPEFVEQHPGFAAGPSADHIGLEPLSLTETEALAAAVVERPDVTAKITTATVERCGGNPFFAEQTVRLMADSAEGTLPGSVQAVIAARLDALPPQDKALLADAAVVGETFWDGALAAMDHNDLTAAGERLDALVRTQFVRRVPASSLEGQSEFAFAHVLTRDVAYGQLPRGLRARKHAAVVAWIEKTASARLDDLADVIAHHCATALELARASGQDALADSLIDPAVRYLALAGDRAMRLDIPSAERLYARALDVLAPRDPGRAAMLVKWAGALHPLGDYQRAAEGLSEAIATFTAAGDTRAAAVAMLKRANSLLSLGDPSVLTLANEALALLEADGPSPELVFALESMASYHTAIDDSEAGIAFAERAVDMAAQLGEPEPIQALHFRGVARCDLGDAGGLEDLQRALAAAEERGTARDVAFMQFNLGSELWLIEGAAAVLEVRRKGQEFTEQRDLRGIALFYAMGRAADLIWAGDWDGALALSLATDPDIETTGDLQDLLWLRTERSVLLALRGEASAAEELTSWVAAKAHTCEDALALLYAAFGRAVAADAGADAAESKTALVEYERLVGNRVEADFALRLPLAVRLALKTGETSLAERLTAHLKPSLPLYRNSLASAAAAMAEARDDAAGAAAGFADAAARWHDFGVPYEEAQALLGQGRCLVALGRAPEAAAPLAAAREIFARLGARPALAETDALLQQVPPA